MQRVYAALIVCGLACAGRPDELTAADVRARGHYCCTQDGAPASGDCHTGPGAVYLADFSHVEPSGTGDACGWILN